MRHFIERHQGQRQDHQPDVQDKHVQFVVMDRDRDCDDEAGDEVDQQHGKDEEVHRRIEAGMVLEVLGVGHDGILHPPRVFAVCGFALGSEIWLRR
jgi:hypothetical protein